MSYSNFGKLPNLHFLKDLSQPGLLYVFVLTQNMTVSWTQL